MELDRFGQSKLPSFTPRRDTHVCRSRESPTYHRRPVSPINVEVAFKHVYHLRCAIKRKLETSLRPRVMRSIDTINPRALLDFDLLKINKKKNKEHLSTCSVTKTRPFIVSRMKFWRCYLNRAKTRSRVYDSETINLPRDQDKSITLIDCTRRLSLLDLLRRAKYDDTTDSASGNYSQHKCDILVMLGTFSWLTGGDLFPQVIRPRLRSHLVHSIRISAPYQCRVSA